MGFQTLEAMRHAATLLKQAPMSLLQQMCQGSFVRNDGSLILMLYACVCNDLPFPGKILTLLRWHRTELLSLMPQEGEAAQASKSFFTTGCNLN